MCLRAGSCTAAGLGGGFCAYHGEIPASGPRFEELATYDVLPTVSICNTGQTPSETGGNANVSGTLDSELHELVGRQPTRSATATGMPRGMRSPTSASTPM